MAEGVHYLPDHVCNDILCGNVQGNQHMSLPPDIASDKGHVQIVHLLTVRRSELEYGDQVRQ